MSKIGHFAFQARPNEHPPDESMSIHTCLLRPNKLDQTPGFESQRAPHPLAGCSPFRHPLMRWSGSSVQFSRGPENAKASVVPPSMMLGTHVAARCSLEALHRTLRSSAMLCGESHSEKSAARHAGRWLLRCLSNSEPPDVTGPPAETS